ncbi:MAG: YegP family protein [Chitinophagaceae bacterium]|nr:YegP family protein [Chitinophagaceae bacterium]
MGKFVVSQRSNGDYQFNLKADNGKVILTSQGYAGKEGCLNGIQSVKQHATQDASFDRQTSANGKPYFSLKAGNGQIIGMSEMYESTAARENGIESVKKNAPDAAVEG